MAREGQVSSDAGRADGKASIPLCHLQPAQEPVLSLSILNHLDPSHFCGELLD